jgi:hypothetical protein
MKKVIVVALVGVFSVFAVGSTVIAAEGPDGNMTINLPAASFDKPKAKTKAPQVGVTFNHKKHGADLKCVGCHHTQPTLGTDAAVKGVSCFSDAAKCHGVVADGKKQTAKDMIHKGSCVKCHKDTVKANAASKAPTKCKDCHGGADE